jgi:hypothetical protein
MEPWTNHSVHAHTHARTLTVVIVAATVWSIQVIWWYFVVLYRRLLQSTLLTLAICRPEYFFECLPSPVLNVPIEGAVISVHIPPKRRDRSPRDTATHPQPACWPFIVGCNRRNGEDVCHSHFRFLTISRKFFTVRFVTNLSKNRRFSRNVHIEVLLIPFSPFL